MIRLLICFLLPLVHAFAPFATSQRSQQRIAIRHVQLSATEALDALQRKVHEQSSELHAMRTFIDAQSASDAVTKERLRMAEAEVDILTTQVLDALRAETALRAELADAQHELVTLRAGTGRRNAGYQPSGSDAMAASR